MLAHVSFPNARYKQHKLRADAYCRWVCTEQHLSQYTFKWITDCDNRSKFSKKYRFHFSFCFQLINCGALTQIIVTRSVNYSSVDLEQEKSEISHTPAQLLCEYLRELVGKKPLDLPRDLKFLYGFPLSQQWPGRLGLLFGDSPKSPCCS